jgi:hypothetical protein
VSERKFNRRDFVKLGVSVLASGDLFACGRTDTTSTPERKSSLNKSTSEPTLTRMPTGIPIPPATSIPGITPIVTNTLENISQTPVIPDLAHLHLEGNTLKTEQGEYAGEIIEYIFNGEKTKGVVLIPSEGKKLMEKANTPQAIAKGNWKIAFPLDARGETSLEVYTWGPPGWGDISFILKQVSLGARLVSPFLQAVEKVDGGNSSGFGKTCDLSLPQDFAQGYKDHVLMFILPKGGYSTGTESTADLGSVVVKDIRGNLGSRAPEGTQVGISLGPGAEYESSEDVDITDNILTLKDASGEEMMVFLAAE